MRTVSPFRVILLSILLAVTAILVHGTRTGSAPAPKVPLRQAFDQLAGWSSSNNQQLSDQIVEELKLDDYLFRSYMNGQQAVTLYVGYYRTASKVGASHDPLVCFQGQGWKVVERSHGSYPLFTAPGLIITYSAMIAERQGERELIVYWFQTNRRTSANTFSQKIDMVSDRLLDHGEDSAFVRITTPIGDTPPATVKKKIFDFIEVFYPVFNKYMAMN